MNNEMSQGFWSLLNIQDLRGVAVQSTNPGSEYEGGGEKNPWNVVAIPICSMVVVVVVGWSNIFGWGILFTHPLFIPLVFFLGSHGDWETS